MLLLEDPQLYPIELSEQKVCKAIAVACDRLTFAELDILCNATDTEKIKGIPHLADALLAGGDSTAKHQTEGDR